MRKILLLFAVLLTSVGASAQTLYGLSTSRVTTFEEGKMYVIYNTCKTSANDETYAGLLYNDAATNSIKVDLNSNQRADISDKKYLWEIIPVEGQEYYHIRSVETGNYVTFSSSNFKTENSESGSNMYFQQWTSSECTKAGVGSENRDGTYTENSNIGSDVFTITADGKTNGGSTSNGKCFSGTASGFDNWESAQPFAIYEAQEVANPSEIVDGVYTINNVYNERGTLAYGTYSGTDYWGLTNITLSGYTNNNITVSNESNQQWCVVTTENGTFFYNVGQDYFMQNTVTDNNPKVTFGEDVPQSGFTTTQRTAANNSAYISVKNGDYYLTFSCGWAPSEGQIRWHTSDEADATLLTFKKVAGDHSAIINEVMKKLYPGAKEELGEAIAAFDQYNTGNGVGQYSSSIANYGGEYAEILDFYNSITEETQISAIRENTASANEILASFSLNMPENGKFYRIAYDYGGEVGKLYLQSTASKVEDKEEGLALTDDEGATSIWYYDEDGGLISYDKGKYLKEVGDSRGLQAIGTTQTVTFSESTRAKSRYLIQASSFLHAANPENGVYFADHCGSNTAEHTTHDFIIEEVDMLPVSISAADYATLYSPVALETTGNVEAYTITVNGEWAHLNRIEDNIIPAKTGVVLFHKNESTQIYDFLITSTDANVETSPLVGTFAATYIEGPAYVLGNGDGGVGFYQAELNRDANGNPTGTTHFLNNAFKAYLPASAVTTNVKALRFNFGDVTGIETITPATDANAPIYDLSGRRVLSTVKGGVYIQNGKKFIVK